MLICNKPNKSGVGERESVTPSPPKQENVESTHQHYAHIRHTVAHGQHGNEVVGFGFKFIRLYHPCGCHDQAIAEQAEQCNQRAHGVQWMRDKCERVIKECRVGGVHVNGSTEIVSL